MKVTPRLPVYGRYADSAFVELRYFCLGAQSKAVASVFGVCEDLSVRKRVLEVSRRSTNPRVLGVALDMEVPSKTRLALWNYEPFLASVLDSLRSGLDLRDAPDEYVTASLLQSLSVRLTRRGEQADPRAITLWWDEDERGVALLYQKHAMDSFFVTNPCKHVHLKTDLLKAMRERMGQPMGRDSMAKLRIECGKDCRTDVSENVIRLIDGITSPLGIAEVNEIYSAIMDSSMSLIRFKGRKGSGRCRYCSTALTQLTCSSGCELCFACCALGSLTQLQMRCPCCGDQLKRSDFARVLERIAKWGGSTLVACDVCTERKQLEEFPSRINHHCAVCNDCAQGLLRSSSRCPTCNCSFSAELSHLREEAKGSQSKDLQKRCEKCSELMSIEKFRTFLRSSHECMVCDSCRGAYQLSCLVCIEDYEREERNRLAIYPSPTDPIKSWCSKCREEKHLAQFSCASQLTHWWKCRICDACIEKLMASATMAALPTCSQCRQPYFAKDITILQTLAKTNVQSRRVPAGAAAPPQDTTTCVVCYDSLPGYRYSIRRELNHPCNVCDDCYIIFDSASWKNQNCPKCKEAMDSSAQTILHKRKKQIEASETVEGICTACNQSMRVKIKSKLDHSCIVCDKCIIENQNSGKCPRCNATYERKDLTYLRTMIPRKMPQLIASCTLCSNPVFPSKLHCPRKCICAECIVKHYLNMNSTKCTNCEQACSGFEMISSLRVECGNCLKILTMSNEDIHGICGNSHVLCVYCITAETVSPKCKRCGGRVLLTAERTGQDVKARQGRFELACYCGFNSGYPRSLPCTHAAHYECLDRLFQCRICSKALKEKPDAKTLRQYLAQQ